MPYVQTVQVEPNRVEPKAIRRPSGDQLGSMTVMAPPVSRGFLKRKRGFPPVAFIR